MHGMFDGETGGLEPMSGPGGCKRSHNNIVGARHLFNWGDARPLLIQGLLGSL